MSEESQNDNKKKDGSAKEDAEEIEEPKKEADKDNADMKDRLLRLAAEFDNYKKRVAKDIDNSKEIGRADVITKLLPTLDEFELALDSFDKKDEHLKGMALIYSNFMSTLKGFGLREMDAKGKFDPYKHEIMLVQDSKEEDDTIIKVVRKGYMLNALMLRPASVIISKHEEAGDKKEEKSG